MITQLPEVIEIVKASYVGEYKIHIYFHDATDQVVDFETFLDHAKNPMTTKYRDKSLFQDFKVEHGDLIW